MFHVDLETYRQTEEWTDMTNLIVIFRNFVNTPKNLKFFLSTSRRQIRGVEV